MLKCKGGPSALKHLFSCTVVFTLSKLKQTNKQTKTCLIAGTFWKLHCCFRTSNLKKRAKKKIEKRNIRANELKIPVAH